MTAVPSLALIFGRPTAAAVLACAFAGSVATAAMVWRWGERRMRRDRWIRPNYRNHRIVGVSGLVVVAVSAVVVVITTVIIVVLPQGEWSYAALALDEHTLLARSPDSGAIAGGIAALVLLGGFGWLGYRDDTRPSRAGQPAARGFVGHLRSSWRRRVITTGMQKALGGAAVALIGVQIAVWGDPAGGRHFAGAHPGDWFDPVPHALGLRTDLDAMWSLAALVRGALIVALAANLANLLDRAPGRATKAALLWWLVALAPWAIVVSGSPHPFNLGPDSADWAVWAGTAVGATVGLLRSELAERHMQGDTGANPLGALLGMATVATYSATVEWVVLGLLAALNLASERWSFSRVIDAVPPLRWLDRLGSPYRRH